MTPQEPILHLTNVRLADPSNIGGGLADVAIVGDRITAVRPAGELANTVGRDAAQLTEADRAPEPTVRDLDGWLLLPAPAEPHAHLDKALTIDRVPNPDGDLLGAINVWRAYRPTITHDDYVTRATKAAEMLAANGCTTIRTHVDLGSNMGGEGGQTGTAALEALLEVKKAMAARRSPAGPPVDLQLVGLIHGLAGPDAEAQQGVLRRALELGLDVVGGVPHLEPDPARAIDLTLELAGEYGRPLDLHSDENLNPESADLPILAERVLATGFEYGVTASHCVALSMRPLDQQEAIAVQVAEAGISVVTLPITNLYLQGREHPQAMPRALTAVAPLMAAGVNVAAGADNLRDPFNPVGRADPLETAMLAVVAGHRSPEEAYEMVSNGSRRALGLEPIEIAPGGKAELLAVKAGSVGEAVSLAPAERLVVSGAS